MPVITAVEKEQAPAELHDIYGKLTSTFGRMPAIFGTMAQRPAVLQSFLQLYGAVMNQGTVEPRYKELAYIKTSMINGCEYCARAHMASGKRIGITEDEIRALTFYQRSNLFDEKDKATLLFVERVTRGASAIREAALENLKKYFKEDQIIELTLVTCMANFTNRYNDALQLLPDIG
jgi:uncharacterized peroxidase-related enzyme